MFCIMLEEGVFEMKCNRIFVVGMLTVLLALGLVFVGCETSSDDSGTYTGPKSIKITGITLTGTEINGEGGVQIFNEPVWGGNSVAREVYHVPRVINGELLVDLKVSAGWDATDAPWTGSGEYYIRLIFAGPAGWSDEGGTSLHYWWTNGGQTPVKYDIKDAVTTLNFSQFRPAD